MLLLYHTRFANSTSGVVSHVIHLGLRFVMPPLRVLYFSLPLLFLALIAPTSDHVFLASLIRQQLIGQELMHRANTPNVQRAVNG